MTILMIIAGLIMVWREWRTGYRWVPIALLLAVCLGHSITAHAQTRPETIRGRVTSDSGVAIVGATVSAGGPA